MRSSRSMEHARSWNTPTTVACQDSIYLSSSDELITWAFASDFAKLTNWDLMKQHTESPAPDCALVACYAHQHWVGQSKEVWRLARLPEWTTLSCVRTARRASAATRQRTCPPPYESSRAARGDSHGPAPRFSSAPSGMDSLR